MPSYGLVMRFPESFTVDQDWRWNRSHYRKTPLDWLDNFDANRTATDAIFG
jgi:cyclopropane-fatty-acyl-phospholipid synthase